MRSRQGQVPRRRLATVLVALVAAGVGAGAVPAAADLGPVVPPLPSADDQPLAYSVTDRFHAIYALPNDVVIDLSGPDADFHPAVMVPRIEHEIGVVRDWFATQTGNRRPRFVLDAAGIEVTVATLAMSSTEIATSGWTGHERIRTQLVQQGVIATGEIGVIYVPSSGPACGATTPEFNGRPAFSVLYMDACGIYPTTTSSFPIGATYLAAHEMTHAFGAVKACAPHYDGTGHVSGDPRDVLNSDGRDWANLMLDPGHDDYYGHGRSDCIDIALHPAWLPPGAGGCDGQGSSTLEVPTQGSGPSTPPPGAGGFVGVGPSRLFDTRQLTSGTVCPGQTLVAQVAGRAGVPATGVVAVIANVTVTANPASGYLSLWPAGQPRPNASNVNFAANENTANLVVATLSPSGQIAIWNADDAPGMDAVHIIVDIVGYFTEGSGFAGSTPTRVLDTRTGLGAPMAPVMPGAEVTLQVTGRAGVPAADVAAVVLNVTVTDAAASGYVSVWPSGQTRPNVSSVNFVAGGSRANLVIVPVGDGGAVKLWNSADAPSMRSIALLADVAGYFSTTGAFHPVAPDRVVDTRLGLGVTGPIPAGGEREAVVVDRAGVPAGAVAVSVNLTATGTSGPGYFTLWPTGSTRPGTSSVNWTAGQTVANAAIATIGADGKLSVWNANDAPQFGSAHVLIDVFGYFAP